MKRRTKIVCTLGPAVNSREKLLELMQAGMNVARINCSHGDWEQRAQWFDWIREANKRIAPVGILCDLQGPKFRLGTVPDGEAYLTIGQTVRIGADPDALLTVPGKEITEAMEVGDRVLLGDGFIELKLIKEVDTDTFEAKVLTQGMVKTKQGVTLVGKSFDVPAITDKDRTDIVHAARLEADFVALSYVRKASDVRELRRLLDQHRSRALTVAKIETRQAVKEIDDIIKVSDILMVARGDLGLQMALDDVPIEQKRIIRKCNAVGTPVITATQMLESMIENAKPTRAEATDVANAIFDGTDAIMLSGETASGKYPIEAVKTMATIAETTESEFDFASHYDRTQAVNDTTSAVARAAVQLGATLKAKAILTTSTSGHTPRMVSKFRPKTPILCTAWSDETHRQLSVVWGVETIRLPSPENTDEVIHKAINGFLSEKKLKIDDTVVITAGVPAGKIGHTNLILVEIVR